MSIVAVKNRLETRGAELREQGRTYFSDTREVASTAWAALEELGGDLAKYPRWADKVLISDGVEKRHRRSLHRKMGKLCADPIFIDGGKVGRVQQIERLRSLDSEPALFDEEISIVTVKSSRRSTVIDVENYIGTRPFFSYLPPERTDVRIEVIHDSNYSVERVIAEEQDRTLGGKMFYLPVTYDSLTACEAPQTFFTDRIARWAEYARQELQQ